MKLALTYLILAGLVIQYTFGDCKKTMYNAQQNFGEHTYIISVILDTFLVKISTECSIQCTPVTMRYVSSVSYTLIMILYTVTMVTTILGQTPWSHTSRYQSMYTITYVEYFSYSRHHIIQTSYNSRHEAKLNGKQCIYYIT